MDWIILQQLAISLGIGLLLGLERERTEPSIAGIRTFPLISMLGTVCAQIATVSGGWVIGAGFLGLAATVISANIARLKKGDVDPGMTTEVAALLLFGVGAMLVTVNLMAAVVVGGAMAVLLHSKQALHGFADAVGERDMRAIIQFVVLSMIILPVLPHQSYGPYGVWNPFKIWLMVVLIVGISLCGYVAYKFLGPQVGTLLGGTIGGIISSTATTVSYARRCAKESSLAPLAALVIMIASCFSLVRVLVEIAAVAPSNFPKLAPPLVAMLLACVGITIFLFLRSRSHHAEMPEQKNPAELTSALVFGAIYAVVLLAVAAAKDHFGAAGLYTVGVISGFTDMDAITLSAAQMTNSDGLDPGTAWRTILIAMMANFVFKFGVVAALATRALTVRVGASFATAIAAGIAIVLFWP